MSGRSSTRRRLVVGVIGVAAAFGIGAAAGIAWTQDTRERTAGGQRPAFPGVSPVFAALDVDRDGTLSPAELVNAPVALAVLDRNNDGALTRDEVRPAFGRGGREGRGEPVNTAPASPDDLAAMLMSFDKNGDGKLTKTEVPERMLGLFDRADADKDGTLTAEELTRSAAATAGPAADRPGFGRRDEGPEREGRRARGEGGRMRGDPLVAALDADRDGTISAGELASASTALRALDRNGDGQLTADEIRPAFGPGGPRDDRRQLR